MEWTSERVARAVELWLAGQTPREIAHELGGVSQSNVYNMLRRRGYRRFDGDASAQEGRRTGGRLARKAPGSMSLNFREVATRVATTDLPDTTGAVDGSLVVPFLERPVKGCCWVIGEATFRALVCGARATRGSYCDGHAAVAYLPREEAA